MATRCTVRERTENFRTKLPTTSTVHVVFRLKKAISERSRGVAKSHTEAFLSLTCTGTCDFEKNSVKRELNSLF